MGPWLTIAEMAPEPADPDRVNIYACETCGGYTMTIDLHRGTTPFTIYCRASGKVGDCPGLATSWGYPPDRPIPAHLPAPAWEWYRPTGEEYERLTPEMQEHVNKGGLDIRPRKDRSKCEH